MHQKVGKSGLTKTKSYGLEGPGPTKPRLAIRVRVNIRTMRDAEQEESVDKQRFVQCHVICSSPTETADCLSAFVDSFSKDAPLQRNLWWGERKSPPKRLPCLSCFSGKRFGDQRRFGSTRSDPRPPDDDCAVTCSNPGFWTDTSGLRSYFATESVSGRMRKNHRIRARRNRQSNRML